MRFHDAFQAGKQKEVHPPYSPYLAPAGGSISELNEISPQIEKDMNAAREEEIILVR
jgi:hypothetical protein